MEKSTFLIVFGDSPKVRVIDFLITFQLFDYNLTDIAKNSGVGYSTLMAFWPDFVKAGMIRETRKVGKSKMFKLNTENPAIKQLLRLDWALSKYTIHKLSQKQILKVNH